MTDLTTLPAPCCIDSLITVDANGYFKRSDGQGAHLDAMRMTKGGKLSMRAMAAFWTDLTHAENKAIAVFNAAESKHGVRGEHPEKTKASEAVGQATNRALRLLAWIAAARPTSPADIGLQSRLILSAAGPLGCIRLDEYAALMAGAKALTTPPSNEGQGVQRVA